MQAAVGGNEVASFSDFGVGNSVDALVPEYAWVPRDGDSIRIRFVRALSTTVVPDTARFRIWVRGNPISTDNIDDPPVVAGHTLVFGITPRIVHGGSVRVSYTDPRGNNTQGVIEDTVGVDAASFVRDVDNRFEAGLGAPPEPLTAAFSGLPTRHTAEAFTFDIAFSEAFPLTAQTLTSALSVANGSVTSVAKVDEASTRSWRGAITPSSTTDNVTVTFAAKQNCADTGAIWAADRRKLSASVEAEVLARKATYVTGVSITSNAGTDGVWNQGETVRVEIKLNTQITVHGPPGSGPGVWITLDGTRRVAGYATGNGSTTLTFEHTVAAPDDRAVRARVVSNSLDLNGYILGDSQGQEAGSYFEVPSELSVADAEGTEGTDSAIASKVTLDPAASAPVTVDYATADGTATAPADSTATSDTLTFARGETSKTVEVPTIDDAEGDNGETFTRTLSHPSGATIAGAVATGTTRNSEAAGSTPLTTPFRDVSVDAHDGSTAFTLELRFSENRTSGLGSLRQRCTGWSHGSRRHHRSRRRTLPGRFARRQRRPHRLFPIHPDASQGGGARSSPAGRGRRPVLGGR